NGRESAHRALRLRPGDDVDIDLELPGGHIAGRVVDDVSGAPVSRLEVNLFRDGNLSTASCQTAEDGSFHLDWLPPDSYRLRIDGHGQGDTSWYEALVVKLPPRDLVLAEGAVLDDLLFRACRRRGARRPAD